MTGAVIPDDWDGSTYKCYRVEWPYSEQYAAILLGSVSKPSYENYWDPETGDQDQAAEAIEAAYNLTVPDFWSTECDEPMLVPAFKVKQTSPQALGASAWQVVEWDAFEYQVNSPDFQLATNVHQLTDSELFGIWHYDVLLGVTASPTMSLRAANFVTGDEIARTHDEDRFIAFSWDYLWDVVGPAIGIHVYPTSVCNTFSQVYLTQFSGHYVGPAA